MSVLSADLVTTPNQAEGRHSNGKYQLAQSSSISHPFGIPAEQINAHGIQNAIVGISTNDEIPVRLGFPTGVTGYGDLLVKGSTSFGIFGRADCKVLAGVCTNELNSFNFAGPPSENLPPDRSINTNELVPVTLTIAAGGTYPSSMGIQIGKEGSSSKAAYVTGIYLNADTITNTGIMIDALNSGPKIGIFNRNAGDGINEVIQTGKSKNFNQAVRQVIDREGVVHATQTQSGSSLIGAGASADGFNVLQCISDGDVDKLGDAQACERVLRRSTDDSKPAFLTSGGGSPVSSNSIILKEDGAIALDGTIIARQQSTGAVAMWQCHNILAKRSKETSSAVIVGEGQCDLRSADSGFERSRVAVTTDKTLGGIVIKVSGSELPTRWVASVHTVEVQ